MAYIITRTKTGPQGTFGMLTDEFGTDLCCTCELPWNANIPDSSCIPAGTYEVIPHNSPEHPATWEITGVPNRSGILIHNGNTENDSLGCVICGDRFGTVDDLPAVMDSDATLAMLRSVLPANFRLEITEEYE